MTRYERGEPTENDMRRLMFNIERGLEQCLNYTPGQIRRFGFMLVVYNKDDPDQHYYASGPRPKLAKNLLQHLIEEIERRDDSK